MASQEIADMIFNLKDKLSDKEFKDIMDKLSIKKKEEEEDDTYMITYIKQEHKLTYDDDNGIYYKIEHMYKQRKVKLFDDADFKKLIDDLIDNNFLNMIDLYNRLKIPSMKIIKLHNQYFLKPYNERRVWLHLPYHKDENENENENENNEDDDNAKGMFLKFNECLIINIKKIS
tara:strand:- start:37 stop:558 length:522 start_codon:yes stop_codon:yes gene_type:complete